ncbi:MAG: DUF4159 domain-containing protein [Planctomycetes bacterium]|nr:DUF4159 domain-containing protein [Planctomycetota bacterium]
MLTARPDRCVVLIVLLCMAASASAQQELTDERVGRAIDAGIEALYDKQEPWGHWDAEDPANAQHHNKTQFGGKTAIVCYALLSAGEQWQGNPKLYEPLKFLAEMSEEHNGTYAVGLRAHVWPKLPDKSTEVSFINALQRDAYMLTQGISDQGTYHYKLGATKYDNSNTQYGVLGVWECAKRGAAVEGTYWKRVRDHFLGDQHVDGGWGYTDDPATIRGSMTAAGLTALYITLDYLHTRDFQRPGVAEDHRVYKSILRGLAWFNSKYQPDTNPGYGRRMHYYHVGVERVGLASGWKYFNGMDWYRAGAEYLLKDQKNDGGWGATHNTAFSLIFLSRGRVPVFANKLATDSLQWNNRPNDLAHMTKWASDQFERSMNWQVIGIGQSPPRDWLDAPILYFASHQSAEQLSEQQRARIKRYIDLGGTLVINDDGGSGTFTRSMRDILEQIYPYRFKPVPRRDPLRDIVFHVSNAKVMSMHNGVRHLVVELPGDAGWVWQSRQTRDRTAWHVMANLFQYAVERATPRNRLDEHVATRRGAGGRVVHVGRARYQGNWDPEPLAWERMSVFTANAGKASPITHRLDLAEIADAEVSMIHIVGTDAVEFTEAQINAIRQYVAGGGVICFEAAGGDTAFSSAAQQMLKKAYPGRRIGRLPTTSPVISGAGIGGFDCSRIDYRVFYKQKLGTAHRPSLQAMMFDGRPQIIVSAEDFTEGMLGQPVWGVFGYDRDSARKLMTNIALYAADVHPASGPPEPEPEAADPNDPAGEPAPSAS